MERSTEKDASNAVVSGIIDILEIMELSLFVKKHQTYCEHLLRVHGMYNT